MHDPKKVAGLIISMGHPAGGEGDGGHEPISEDEEACAADFGNALADFQKSDTPETRTSLFHAFAAMQAMTDKDDQPDEGEEGGDYQ